MYYSNNPVDSRRFFFECWEKFQNNILLEPLEKQIVDVISEHPEYHSMLQQPDSFLYKEWTPESGETNPFLHMGLHLAIREQINTNRPVGIQTIYQQLVQRKNDPHEVEHLMMEKMAEFLWAAQRNHQLPDESAYLEALKGFI